MISVQTSPFLHPACVCTLYQKPDTTITRLSRGPLEQNYLPQHMQILLLKLNVVCSLQCPKQATTTTHIILSLAEGMNGLGGGGGEVNDPQEAKLFRNSLVVLAFYPLLVW